MDTIIEKKKESPVKKYWYVPVVVVLIAVVYWAKGFFGNASYVAASETIRTATVLKGEFFVDIRGNGLLKAKEYHWVASEVAGRVEKLYVKAGDVVEVGDPIIKLNNPQLYQSLEKARWDYKLISAEAEAALKNLDSLLLETEAAVLTAELTYKQNALQLNAEEALIELNQASISKLDFTRTQFSVTESKARWDMQKKRLDNMKDNIQAQREAEAARLENSKNNVLKFEQQVEFLTVKASVPGVIQHLELELGQKIELGAGVARLADNKNLIAELKIQELQVQSVSKGQPVIIDTRHNQLHGEVIRINPAVVDGMVQVDVNILDDLPSEARPDLSVEGSIRTDQIDQTLYVERPTFSQRYSDLGIYKISQDRNKADRVTVSLGQSSVNYVQVLKGLREGDEIIISDPTSFEQHQTIFIN